MKRILSVLALVLFANVSMAGIRVEPYAGFGLGVSGDYTTTISSSAYSFDSSPSSGLEFGGRVGYSMLGAFAAFDYSMSSFDTEDQLTSLAGVVQTGLAKNTSEVDQTAMGITVGYELPILLSAWVKYVFNVSWDIEQDKSINSTDTINKELKGSGFGIGAGFTGLPFVTIFAEWMKVTMDEVDSAVQSGTDVSATLTGYERTRSSIMIGVSAPFDF